MFYKSDTRIITILRNIYRGLKNDWDYVLVVVGDTGTGKSVWGGLQLIDTWYKVILKHQSFNAEERSKQICSDYNHWLKNFQMLGEYDVNVYDEAATSLESRDHMSKISKDITKLYNVIRAKRFFTVIIIPNFFYLNKYFREHRVRGLVWVNARGQYKFFTKEGIKWLNAYNERRIVKSMSLAHPFHVNTFPNYDGEMLPFYRAQKTRLMDKLIAEVISFNVSKGEKLEAIQQGFADGRPLKELHEEFGVEVRTLQRWRKSGIPKTAF